jgi:NAD(P)-dependent dehydrogenase (short-subunit alcohol dehydrogenase family)
MPATFTALRGKTALITGAARRLGRDTALRLAADGVGLVLHCHRSRAACEATAQEARALGIEAHVVSGDLRRAEERTRVLEEALTAVGTLDILVNNASTFEESQFAGVTSEAVYESIEINALAPFQLARAFAAQASGGVIINFLDTMIADYDRKHVAYHLSKRMLYTLTRIMAVELAPAFRVNAVAPGLVLPPEGKGLDYLEGLKSSNFLETYGDEATISETVVFLLRNEFVTGQVIFVDGGRNLRGTMYD